MKTIHFSEFSSYKSPTIIRRSMSKEDFLEKLSTFIAAMDKYAVPLFSPAVYVPQQLTRKNEAVESLSFLCFDIERKEPGPLTLPEVKALVDRLRASGLEFLLVSSFSNTPADCRFRLVLFPDRPILPTEFREVRTRMERQLGMSTISDPACKDPARIFFFPCTAPGSSPSRTYSKGNLVQVDEVLEGYTPVPFVPLKGTLPETYVGELPEDPTGPLDLGPFHTLLQKYKGKGEDAQERASKLALVQKVLSGSALCTSLYNNTLWRVSCLLVGLLPSGTPVAVFRALLTPAMKATYANGPIPLEQAWGEYMLPMLERAILRKMADEAVAAEQEKEIERAFKEGTEAIKAAEENPPSMLSEWAVKEEACKKILFVYNIHEQRFYFRSGKEKNFGDPVLKDGMTARLRSMGWDMETVKQYVHGFGAPVVLGHTFVPFQPSIVEKNGEKYLNTWRPPDIDPVPGTWPSIQRVLDSVFLNEVLGEGQAVTVDRKGQDWFLNWCAYKIQHPEVAPGIGVIFNGPAQGTGKGIVYTVLRTILGAANCELLDRNNLEGQFNSRWAGKALLFADEILNQDNRDFSDRLKALVTSSHVIYEAKGKDQKNVENHSAWIFASNHAVPMRLDPQDRRFSVFTRNENVPEEYKKFCRSLFPHNRPTPEFVREIQAFYHDMKVRAVDESAARTPFDNVSRRVLIEGNATSRQAFCTYVDNHGLEDMMRQYVMKEGRTGVVLNPLKEFEGLVGQIDFGRGRYSVEKLYLLYKFWAQQNGFKALGMPKFGAELKAHRNWKQCSPLGKDNVQHTSYTIPFYANQKQEPMFHE